MRPESDLRLGAFRADQQPWPLPPNGRSVILTSGQSLLTRLPHQGDNVSKLEPTQREWYRTFNGEREFTKEMIESIYQCEDDDPPTRLTRSVKKLCVFRYTLDVTYDFLEDYINMDGENMKRLYYTLEMIPSGASNEFRVFYEGEKLASHNVSTEFQ